MHRSGDVEPSRTDLTKDEEFGVQLPLVPLASSILTVIAGGLVPPILAFYGIIWLYGLMPAGLIFTIVKILLAPAFFWLLYFMYLCSVAILTKIFLWHYERCCPAEEGVFNRQFRDKKDPDYKKLHYYHMRGAVVKFSVWITQKSPFPYLIRNLMHFFGHNHIGSNVIYENCFIGLEMTRVGDDAVVEAGSALSAHVVESLYGDLIVRGIVLGKGSVVGTNTIVGPGVFLKERNQVGDNCMTFENWPLVPRDGDESRFFLGSPARQADFTRCMAEGRIKAAYLSKSRETT